MPINTHVIAEKPLMGTLNPLGLKVFRFVNGLYTGGWSVMLSLEDWRKIVKAGLEDFFLGRIETPPRGIPDAKKKTLKPRGFYPRPATTAEYMPTHRHIVAEKPLTGILNPLGLKVSQIVNGQFSG
jgi:hypothetical protein